MKLTLLKRIVVTVMMTTLFIPQFALAQQTLLPENSEYFGGYEAQYEGLSDEEKDLLKTAGIVSPCGYFLQNIIQMHQIQERVRTASSEVVRRDILACAVETGNVKLWMLPYFISYIANFVINITGTISVLMVLLGGFWYMTGGISDDKEKGKKTITYALIGLGLSMLAWIIVNIIQVAVTS